MSNEAKCKKAIFEYNNKGYCYSDILNIIKVVGIKKRDSVFVHSDLKSFGKINSKITRNEFIEPFIEAFKEAVGLKGNIIIPTFSYTFCKKETFDPEITPSTVGILTEYFRKMKDVKRSIDPIFSVAVFGPDKEYFTDVGTDCFGKQSVFEKLYERNAKIVFLGETFDITYMHFVEQKFDVPYRFMKKFKGKIKIGEEMREATFNYYVRCLDRNVEYDLKKIAKYLERGGVLKKAPLGHSQVRSVRAVDAFNVITQGLKENIHILLKERPRVG